MAVWQSARTLWVIVRRVRIPNRPPFPFPVILSKNAICRIAIPFKNHLHQPSHLTHALFEPLRSFLYKPSKVFLVNLFVMGRCMFRKTQIKRGDSGRRGAWLHEEAKLGHARPIQNVAFP
jgi:hypothetical protein